MLSRFTGGSAPLPRKVIAGCEIIVLPVGINFFSIYRVQTALNDGDAAYITREDCRHRQIGVNVGVNAGGVASFVTARDDSVTIGAFITIPLGVTAYIIGTLGNDPIAAGSLYTLFDDNRSGGNHELAVFLEFDIVGNT